MPKRTDIKKIMLIGSGPIVIGQGCEFDYSGVQACSAGTPLCGRPVVRTFLGYTLESPHSESLRQRTESPAILSA